MSGVPLTADEIAALDSAKLARIKAALLAYFEKQPRDVSFVELERAVGPDATGDCAITNDTCRELNIWWWFGVSLEFSRAVGQLLTDDLVVTRPCSLLVYAIDGRYPTHPIAQSTTRSYKKPRWLPLVFSIKRGSA